MSIIKLTRLAGTYRPFAQPCFHQNVVKTSVFCSTVHKDLLIRRNGTFSSRQRTLMSDFSCGRFNVPICGLQPQYRGYGSMDSKKPQKDDDSTQLSIFQRFKIAYKEHGKVLIGVHVATSVIWFGSFFYIVHTGFDIIPVLEKIGFSEKIVSPFRNSSLGDTAVAYLMYKLATPARYTVTLAGTNFAIKYLRKTGKLPEQEEKLRDLYKDSKSQIGQKMTEEIKEHRDKLSKIRQRKRKKPNEQVKKKMLNSLRSKYSSIRNTKMGKKMISKLSDSEARKLYYRLKSRVSKLSQSKSVKKMFHNNRNGHGLSKTKGNRTGSHHREQNT